MRRSTHVWLAGLAVVLSVLLARFDHDVQAFRDLARPENLPALIGYPGYPVLFYLLFIGIGYGWYLVRRSR